MSIFDPSAPADPGAGLFGLPFSEEESRLVVLPVPWDATASYHAGAAAGPAAIAAASRQVDLHDLDVERPYAPGIYLRPSPREIESLNRLARASAEPILAAAGHIDGSAELSAALARVNAAGRTLNEWVFGQVEGLLRASRIPAVLGGDHSVSLGAFQAVGEHHGDFGLLHVDAHSDTRDAYEGFTFSHASIMHNALSRVPSITRLVQVGIRDVCEQEVDFCKAAGERVRTFTDRDLSMRRFAGEPWQSVCRSIVEALPRAVWITFDIDGLQPALCPHTGTPVPGGLDFQEANFLVGEVARSGRVLLGFDLTEVSPDPQGASDWDENVGARLLYKLCAWAFASRGLARLL